MCHNGTNLAETVFLGFGKAANPCKTPFAKDGEFSLYRKLLAKIALLFVIKFAVAY